MSMVTSVLSGRHEQIAVESRHLLLAPITSLNYQPNHLVYGPVIPPMASIGLIMSDLKNSPDAPVTWVPNSFAAMLTRSPA